MNQPQPTPTHAIDELLDLLRCPVEQAPLVAQGERLVCTGCGRAFPIVDGIPNMLITVEAAPQSRA